jgi:hypothetical protein
VTEQPVATAPPLLTRPLVPTGSGLVAVLLGVVAALGVARIVWRLFGLAVLLGVVLATVAALVGGITMLRLLVGA